MLRADILNYLLDNKIGYKGAYLEIGLSDPNRNYFHIRSANKECVDPIEGSEGISDENYRQYIIDNVLTYRMTSDEFFEQCNKKYDLIFIDGLHIGEQVVKDFINSYNHLNEGGYILMHDCLPPSEERQFENCSNITLGWNGTTWKAIPNLYKAGLNFYTIGVDEGCALVKYQGKKDFSNYTVTDLSYNEVFSNINIRNTIMHVITEEEFYEL